MTYTRDTPIQGSTTVTVAQAVAYALSVGTERRNELAAYVRELWRLSVIVGYDATILLGQGAHETGEWSDASPWWPQRLNPAGIGVTGDPAQDAASPTYTTGEDAARAQVVHMVAYVHGNMTAPLAVMPYLGLDPRWSAVHEAGFSGSVDVIGDLGNGRWAVDPDYAAGLVGHANAIAAYAAAHPTGGTMKIVATQCPIETKIIPVGSRNRPGLAMPDPSFVTIHEVGNTSPGADEDMHEQFVRNGGGENSVSFQGVCGPTKFIQLMPMNEAAWHASDGYSGRGNRDSFAIETIQIGDFNRTLNHLAWVVAEMFRNPRRFAFNAAIPMIDDLPPALVKERVKQHNFWAPDRKNCPQFIRDRGLWGAFLDAVEKELNGKKSSFVAPVLPSWWNEQALLDLMPQIADGRTYTPLGTRLTALKPVTCYANGLDRSAGKTRASLRPGDTADVRYTYRDKDDHAWGITRYGTHVRLSSFTPQIIVRDRGRDAA